MAKFYVQTTDDDPHSPAARWWNLGSDEGHDTLEIAISTMRHATGRITNGAARVVDSEGKQYAAVHAGKGDIT